MSTELISFNPANGDQVGSVPTTPVDAVPAVVAKAHVARAAWADLGLEGRLKRLQPVAQRMIDRADEIGRLMSCEMGKPLAEAIGEVRWCGEAVEKELLHIVAALSPTEHTDGRRTTFTLYDPLGVCAVITPWNFPFSMPHWLILPALMAGNTVVFKPSEETPLTGQAYANCLIDLLPPDVLQVVHGDERQGKALVAADVELIAFTGSREAGKAILAAAAPQLKRVLLELGGKDPLVVLDDADVQAAAKFAARNGFRNAGQVCVSTERVLVQSAVADAFVEAMAELAEGWVVGDGLEDGVRMGPMVNARQKAHVVAQIHQAVGAGAMLVAGGVEHPLGGNFLPATVLVNVDASMDISREETFGPVVTIEQVQSDDHAVERANDGPFGLGAVVFGGDGVRAAQVARRLDAGMIGINGGISGVGDAPWVGAKESGYGFHKSPAGHRQFTQLRILTTKVGG